MASSICPVVETAIAEHRELDNVQRNHLVGCRTCQWKQAQAIVAARLEGLLAGGVMPREGDDAQCSLAEVFFPPLAAGQLPRFEAAFRDYGPDAGNCHDVALALMTDLFCLKRTHGWWWARGNATFELGPIDHSWCEYDGWAIDAANGKILITDARWYRAHVQASGVRTRNPQQTKWWMSMRARATR